MPRCLSCKKYAFFGKRGSKKAEYCKEHSPSDYVDVKNKTCIHPNCETLPVYGKRGSKKAEYCKEHSPADYVDVKSKTCIHPNCETRPVYGKRGSKKAEYCKEHSPADYVDVMHKTCIHPNCETRPSYGYSGYSQEYCSKHKLPRMIINPLKKEKDEEKLCEQCATMIHYNEEYCSGCKKYLTLKTTVKSHQKELRIKNLLEDHEIKFYHDRIVEGGCSKRRPDFVIPTEWVSTVDSKSKENQISI